MASNIIIVFFISIHKEKETEKQKLVLKGLIENMYTESLKTHAESQRPRNFDTFISPNEKVDGKFGKE